MKDTSLSHAAKLRLLRFFAPALLPPGFCLKGRGDVAFVV